MSLFFNGFLTHFQKERRKRALGLCEEDPGLETVSMKSPSQNYVPPKGIRARVELTTIVIKLHRALNPHKVS